MNRLEDPEWMPEMGDVYVRVEPQDAVRLSYLSEPRFEKVIVEQTYALGAELLDVIAGDGSRVVLFMQDFEDWFEPLEK